PRPRQAPLPRRPGPGVTAALWTAGPRRGTLGTFPGPPPGAEPSLPSPRRKEAGMPRAPRTLLACTLLLLGAPLAAPGQAGKDRPEVLPPPGARGKGEPSGPAVLAPASGPGESLPPGAVARWGSLRLRHVGQVGLLAFSPDGKSLLSLGADQYFCLWD